MKIPEPTTYHCERCHTIIPSGRHRHFVQTAGHEAFLCKRCFTNTRDPRHQ